MSRSIWKIFPSLSSRFYSFFEPVFYGRGFLITPKLLGKRVYVHDGHKTISFSVREGHVGRYVGEFSPTKVMSSRIHIRSITKKKSKAAKNKSKKL